MNKTPKKKFLGPNKIEQVHISRSFSKKLQINQYEPVDVFCSYQAVLKGNVDEASIQRISMELHRACVSDTERDMKNYYESHKKPF